MYITGPTQKKLPINKSESKVSMITGKHLASKVNDELVVTVEGNRLVNVKSVSLLGLTLNSSLSFDCQLKIFGKRLPNAYFQE